MGLTDAQKADCIKSLEAIREQMNAQINQCIANIMENAEFDASIFELCWYITETYRLKGEKPATVIMPSGAEHQVKKWTEVVKTILEDCNADPQCHERLLCMRDKVFGRSRALFSSSSTGMTRPVQISNEAMYFEAYFDTENLLNILLRRVLELAGYDYRRIRIRCRLRQKMQM